jgi:hypothetical protein
MGESKTLHSHMAFIKSVFIVLCYGPEHENRITIYTACFLFFLIKSRRSNCTSTVLRMGLFVTANDIIITYVVTIK